MEEKIKKAVEQINENKHIDFLVSLSQRWDDEKEHEDWNEYEKVIKKKFDYLKVSQVTKRPFGLKFKVDETEVTIALKKKKKTIEVEISY